MKNIILTLAIILLFFGCQKNNQNPDAGRSIDEILKICKELDSPCYRREYAKDIANSSTSTKFGMTVYTEGEGDKTIVFKTNQFTTDSLSSTKQVFADLGRMGSFRQIKFIGSDSKTATYPTGYDR